MDTPVIPPCPENWESCLTCGARPEETCRDPDVEKGPRMGYKGMYAHETLGDHEEVRATNRRIALDLGADRDVPAEDGSGGSDAAALQNYFTSTSAVERPAAGQPRAIIGLTGYKRAGKDTFAAAVREVLGDENVAVVRNADCLKIMLRAMLGYAGLDEAQVEDCIEGDLKEVPCPALQMQTPRHAMLTLGTEWGRTHIHADIWAELLKAHIRSGEYEGKVVLVPDVRFPNEASTVHNLGGEIVRITRFGLEPDLSHESEQHVARMHADEELTNRSLEEFKRLVAGWAWEKFLA